MNRARLAVLAALVPLFAPDVARACGCFAPPDPTVPVVQSGEQILFSARNGQVTAIIQIQYQGAAGDFGWLLPLPSVPTLEVSSDELFTRLQAATAPTYFARSHSFSCPQSPAGHGVPDLEFTFAAADAAAAGGPDDPLVIQGGVGPYDYAVLKADDKQAMLDWLKQNRYFVPSGTDGVVDRYIHPGAYFLALKLRPGRSDGDLAPVVVHYASDLPMIPLVLTSVTATADMGVWVWLAGPARGIPRNYRHLVLDDAALGWFNYTTIGDATYEAQVTRAVREVDGHHAFVTEMAQPLDALREAILPAARYGDLADLRTLQDAGAYLRYLREHDYSFSSTLVEVLARYIKQPPGLGGGRIPPPDAANYFFNFDYWRQSFPEAFAGFDLSFDAVALTAEIEARFVKPMRDARALLDAQDYLTRLHTRLGAADMTSDPVFDYNRDLPTVASQHLGDIVYGCAGVNGGYIDTLYTEQGFVVPIGSRFDLPGALRVEVLGMSGPPTVEVDNTERIRQILGQRDGERFDADAGVVVGAQDSGGACAVGPAGEPPGRGPRPAWLLLAVPLLGLALRRLRRRPRA